MGPMVDYSVLRTNMVESQVRTNEVTDRRLLRAMLDVPREQFVPEAQTALAYNGEGIVLGGGRALPPPMTTARLIQLAAVNPTEHVLEVGCATGYGTALLAHLAANVTGLDVDAALAAKAKANVAGVGLTNDGIETGPLEAGWAKGAPYDVIVVSGAIAEVPEALRAQLRDGGRLVAVIAEGAVTRAMLFEKQGPNFTGRFAFNVPAPVLPGFARKPAFAL
jgi:protein-L-isoaspartate(D-aspartate) O-methyltransferase